VPHVRLLTKLKSYGLAGNLLGWLKSFLSGRKQKVVLNGQSSPWCNVLSGVPQGSVLGPFHEIGHLDFYLSRGGSRIFGKGELIQGTKFLGGDVLRMLELGRLGECPPGNFLKIDAKILNLETFPHI